ncbi:type III secretion system protein SctP [Trinickia sp.]|uniref:type III secretion system protein SctP n=1 Tax=Trinickia sp. TaxID=2571163 RepID=UPI003F7E81C9
MSNRTHNARDVRILPAALPNAPAGSSPSRVSAGAAAQFARLLAAQSGSGAAPLFDSSDGGGASDHDAQDEPEQGSADSAIGDAIGDAICGESIGPQARGEAASPARAGDPAPQAASTSAPRTLRLQRTQGKQAVGVPRPEQDTVLGRHIVHACAVAAHGDLLTRELADRIARFCSMSGGGGDSSWAVTLPMNPAVLPDTLLHLQLSPSSIAIRFETPNARALQLISDNADALRVRLADALGRHIDVDVAASSV